MVKYVYVKRYYGSKHFERIVIKDEKGNVVKIIIKVNRGDVLDAMDFVD